MVLYDINAEIPVYLSNDTFNKIKSIETHNWNRRLSPKNMSVIYELVNTWHRRIDSTIQMLSVNKPTSNNIPDSNNIYQCEIQDDIGIIKYQYIIDEKGNIALFIVHIVFNLPWNLDGGRLKIEHKIYNTINNMKNTIRLTESQLHNVIKESVKQVISEMKFQKYAALARERAKQGRDQDYLDNIDDMTNQALKRDYPSEKGNYATIHTYARTPHDEKYYDEKNPLHEPATQFAQYPTVGKYDPFDYFPFGDKGLPPSPSALFNHNLESGKKWDIRNHRDDTISQWGDEIDGQEGIRVGDDIPVVDALSQYFGNENIDESIRRNIKKVIKEDIGNNVITEPSEIYTVLRKGLFHRAIITNGNGSTYEVVYMPDGIPMYYNESRKDEPISGGWHTFYYPSYEDICRGMIKQVEILE
ncbi:MAG: hypothetical protein HUJ68_06055, partial [Clostridia bacterium]|nr:hypothetical protein [Clostridia bacterium]